MKTLLKNGEIYDGSGEKPFNGDVLVENERILEVGVGVKSEADRTIDCSGLCIAPGFIDAHTHNDFFIEKSDSERFFSPFIRQGITTQISGNCGFSSFGVAENSPHKEKIGNALFHAENPGSFAHFVENTRNRLHLNIAPLIGHGSVRTGVNGSIPSPLTPAGLDEMLHQVREAMQAGAIGGSIGLVYEPGMYAPRAELVAFAKEIAKYNGILTTHPRANSKIALAYRPIFTKPHIEIALNELTEIKHESGVKLHYSHLIHIGEATWRCCDRILSILHSHGITYDIYAFCHGATVITVILPPWYLSLSQKKRSSKFVQVRLKLLIHVASKLLGLGFDDMVVADIAEKHKAYLGKTIAELAKSKGLSDIDMYIKLVELSDGSARIRVRKYNNEEIVRKLMQDDLSMFMTDAWIEDSGIQNQTAFQGIPYFLVRAREMGMPLESAIHKMTGKTAERFCLPSRGLLKAGNFADITVFDYSNMSVNLEVPNSTPKGIKYVLINGNVVIDDEVYTPMTCGQMVLKNNL